MHKEVFSRSRVWIAGIVIGLGTLAGIDGCKRPPAPDVMATVNGKDITQAELEKFYKATLGETPQDPSPEQANIVKLNILHQMIQDEILQERAAKLNLAASDEDVNAKLTDMKTPYTQEGFDQQLKQRNLTLDDLKKDIRKRLTQDKLLNREIYSKIDITDAQVSTYYNAHKADFNLIEPQYHLAQIVVSGNPPQAGTTVQSPKTPNEAQARKEIQTIHSRLESGEDFGSLAMQFSENPNSAPNGGDMGFVNETQLRADAAAYAAISKLRPGQITESLPVYDGAGPNHKVVGYAIYKLLGREAAGQRELNDPNVQQTIRQGLRESQAQLLKNAYFEMLHDQAKVKNYFAEQILKTGGQ